MMKKSSFLIAAAMVVVVFSSCKKEECHECHYEKNGAEVELGERCDEDLEAIEASGYNDGGTVYDVHCFGH